jgi:hypothetical protein
MGEINTAQSLPLQNMQKAPIWTSKFSAYKKIGIEKNPLQQEPFLRNISGSMQILGQSRHGSDKQAAPELKS